MRTDYNVSIIDASRELTKKESVVLKDTSDCVSIDEMTEDGPILIEPVMYVQLAIHNEKAEDKDYNKVVIVTKGGEKYVTGSGSFTDSFFDIWADMEGCDEPWQLKIYRKDSRNRQGKYFITCSVV